MDGLDKIAAEITIEDLPEDYQIVAEICGLENALKLSKHMSSMRIYVPSFLGLIRGRRDACIRAEFNGSNHKDLARKYRMSETWIRKILS